MTQTLPLSQWLSAPRPSDLPVAWLDDRTWTLGHLRQDVARLVHLLQQQEGDRWALCFEDSYLFIVALLATLHAGKTPVIPGHCRAALLDEQRALFDGVLSEKTLGWQGPLLVISASMAATAATETLPPIRDDAAIELFTSGSTGQPKRVHKAVKCLDDEAALLAAQFGERLAGCRIVASVVPQHQYGLSFRIMLPMALGLPLHAAMLWYAEQLSALSHDYRYAFISSPAFLKRLDPQLTPPPVAMVLSAGGMLPWQDVVQAAEWLQIWPDEIYGSTETGILAWRYRQQEAVRWQPFRGVRFHQQDETLRVFSPLIAEEEGITLDDILHIDADGQFSLTGRRGRVVKIEEKRISLSEVEQRLLSLPGVREAAAVPVLRHGRQAIGALLVLDAAARQHWQREPSKQPELAWRRALQPWLEPVAVPRYWRVIDAIPVNSMNKRVYAQLQEWFHETP